MGIYCVAVAGVSPASATILVTPDEAGTGESREIGHLDSSSPDCPGAFEVVTRRIEFDPGTQTTTAFHHDNGFSFVVP